MKLKVIGEGGRELFNRLHPFSGLVVGIRADVEPGPGLSITNRKMSCAEVD
ncbi:MAG: hypothetical protein H8D67_25885 [Deltaproteobacteria bacterium]|nr:hypothetical protein [Deltaproteobacteria bacterium]